MDDSDQKKLRDAMEWVIPTDSSPGAGTSETVAALADLVDSLGLQTEYWQHVPKLTQADFNDSANAFANMFVEHVRDVYYATQASGAWSDIGYQVTA